MTSDPLLLTWPATTSSMLPTCGLLPPQTHMYPAHCHHRLIEALLLFILIIFCKFFSIIFVTLSCRSLDCVTCKASLQRQCLQQKNVIVQYFHLANTGKFRRLIIHKLFIHFPKVINTFMKYEFQVCLIKLLDG